MIRASETPIAAICAKRLTVRRPEGKEVFGEWRWDPDSLIVLTSMRLLCFTQAVHRRHGGSGVVVDLPIVGSWVSEARGSLLLRVPKTCPRRAISSPVSGYVRHRRRRGDPAAHSVFRRDDLSPPGCCTFLCSGARRYESTDLEPLGAYLRADRLHLPGSCEIQPAARRLATGACGERRD